MLTMRYLRYQIGPTHWRQVLWPFDLIPRFRLIVNVGRWHFLWIGFDFSLKAGQAE